MRPRPFASSSPFASALVLGLVAAAAGAQTPEAAGAAARKAKAKFGAYAVRLADGAEIVAIDADLPLIPASNQKTLTCAAAALGCGLDAEFRTEYVAHGASEDGVLRGALRVRGEGDPTCGRQDFGESLDALRAVVEKLKARGLKSVAGDLLLDDSAFDEARVGPAWPNDAPTDRWMAPTAALSFDEAVARLIVRVGADGAEAAPTPDLGFVRVANRLTIAEAPRETAVSFERGPEGAVGALTAKGAVRRGATAVAHEASVDDPTLFFGHAFRRALADAGVAVSGAVRRATPEERLGGEVRLTVRTPFARVLPRLLKHSQNHRADMLFRHLGYRDAGLGSFAHGAAAVRKALASAGVPLEGVTIADGSGLSRDNRATARALVGALRAVAARPDADVFRAALATPGEEGTLERRLPALKGKFFGKTGSLDGASSLTGYLVLPGGERIAFAVLANGAPNQALRKYVDDFALALARR